MGVVPKSVCFLIMCILCGVTKQKQINEQMLSTVVWCVSLVFPCECVFLLLSPPSVIRGGAVKRFKEEQGGMWGVSVRRNCNKL